MSVSILSFGRRGRTPRPRVHRCSIGVERMESRTLMASAAVTSAVYTVQQTRLDLHRMLSEEVRILKSNMAGLQDATNAFIYTLRSDILTQRQDALSNPANAASARAAIAEDELNIKHAIRDQKFALHQQSELIKHVNTLDKQVTASTDATIKLLYHGRIDPATIPDTATAKTDRLKTTITTLDETATKDYNGLISTLNSGIA